MHTKSLEIRTRICGGDSHGEGERVREGGRERQTESSLSSTFGCHPYAHANDHVT
jgi:hypothetical protein